MVVMFLTNEDLILQFYSGDESALLALYHKNTAFIRSVAIEVAKSFGCYHTEENRPKQLTTYTKTILAELTAEGAVEFFAQLRNQQYDRSKGMLTTYFHPHLKGTMYRYMESSLGVCAVSKDDMAAIRKAQKLYHDSGKDDAAALNDIAVELGISTVAANRHIGYNTHFLSVNALMPEDYDGNPYEQFTDKATAPPHRIVYRKICIELLQELFDTLPRKDREILGKSMGVFGYKKIPLDEIALEQVMRVDGVVKARDRALEKLRDMYEGSRLQVWKRVWRMVMRVQ
jgi:DNA-directed RNA polymerase specialized sigma subunit